MPLLDMPLEQLHTYEGATRAPPIWMSSGTKPLPK